jgi:hypothetical protein
MISFKRFCEEFIHYDSQVARTGGGPSVSNAASTGILRKPSQVSTPVVGDLTSFSGNNVYLVQNAKIPFELKLKEKDGMFSIIIRTKGDEKFIPLSRTEFGKQTECDFDDKEEAIQAVRELIFRISQVETPQA